MCVFVLKWGSRKIVYENTVENFLRNLTISLVINQPNFERNILDIYAYKYCYKAYPIHFLSYVQFS